MISQFVSSFIDFTLKKKIHMIIYFTPSYLFKAPENKQSKF